MCNGPAKKVSAGIALCNIKGRKLFGNVETGLEMLFTLPKPSSCWLSKLGVDLIRLNPGHLLQEGLTHTQR